MKLRFNGLTSFKMDFKNIALVTDPLELVDSGLKLEKGTADVVVMSNPAHLGKTGELISQDFDRLTKSDKREKIVEITGPGEYEAGNVMIRRAANSEVYYIDEGECRVLFIGFTNDSIDLNQFKDSGDVDILILPVGEGPNFPSYEKLEKIISYADPTVLVPCGYKADGMTGEYGELKSFDDFVKEFGYANVREEKVLNYSPGSVVDEKNLDVVKLLLK